MDISEVIISEWAQAVCERWQVDPDELAQARINGSVFFEESAIEHGRVVIWGPQRQDGTHLYIVCGPEPHVVWSSPASVDTGWLGDLGRG